VNEHFTSKASVFFVCHIPKRQTEEGRKKQRSQALNMISD